MSFSLRAGGRLIATACVLFAGQALAFVEPALQYKTYLTKAQTIDPVGDFGEQISPREGKLSFRHVDIEVPGNGPTIRIVRTAQLDEGYGTRMTSGNAVGGWEIEIPRLKTVTADPDPFIHANPLSANSPRGWQVPGADMNARCANFNKPPTVSYGVLLSFYPANWWFGYQLVDDAGNEHAVSTRSSGLPGPQYVLGTTTGHWVIACLPQTSNSEPGDAFQAISPDGTKYWLDRLTYGGYSGLTMPFADMPPKGDTINYTLPRRSAAMLVTRVEDRFGNWLKYNYSGSRVTSIEASDGRQVALDWQTDGLTITVGAGSATRTWTYVASDSNSMVLTQPDGSKWQYTGEFHLPRISAYVSEGCALGGLGNEPSGTREVSVRAPSGATATFALKQRFFGRSYVPQYCSEPPSFENPDQGYALYAKAWISYAMTSKTVTGPGLPTMAWNYSYSPHNAAWLADCPNDSCPDEVWTDVVGPDGNKVRSTFSNRWDQTENKLLKQQFYDGGTLLRTETYTYATAASDGANPYPWPLFVAGFTNYNANPQVDQRWTPLKQKVVVQQGTTYAWKANTFDEWSNPLSVTRSNDAPGGYSRTDVAAYHDNLTKWVIGQVASSTNSDTGLVESQTTYDANAMPWKIYAFGELRQTLTYDTASSVASGQRGTLKTSADGKGNVTAYADWRRGLPQSIVFADGKTKSAVVGDLGTIASVQDENLYNTYYDYDAMGRVSTIDYPNGDPVDWNNTTSDFVQVNSAEYGLPAGHWRQTVRTGNGLKTTYYDGLWRPRLVREYDSGNPSGTIRSSLFCYDHEGRQTYASYAKGDVANVSCSLTGTRTTYDALGRVKTVEQDSELGAPTVTATEYLSNSDGPYTKVTNPRGFVTRTWHQAFDAPGGAPVAIQHPEGAYTDIVRDVFGKPRSITRRNSTGSVAIARQYVYSPEQRLCKRVEPETGATVLHYDAAGNLDWSASGLGYTSPALCNEASVAESVKVKRTYDARNRIESLAFPDGRGNTNYTYTPDGLLATIAVDNGAGTDNLVDEGALQGQVGLPEVSQAWAGGGEVSDALPLSSINVVTTSYGYNRRRLPVSERVQWGSLDWSLGYAYNSNGHLATLSYPDNHSVGYTPAEYNSIYGKAGQTHTGWTAIGAARADWAYEYYTSGDYSSDGVR